MQLPIDPASTLPLSPRVNHPATSGPGKDDAATLNDLAGQFSGLLNQAMANPMGAKTPSGNKQVPTPDGGTDLPSSDEAPVASASQEVSQDVSQLLAGNPATTDNPALERSKLSELTTMPPGHGQKTPGSAAEPQPDPESAAEFTPQPGKIPANKQVKAQPHLLSAQAEAISQVLPEHATHLANQAETSDALTQPETTPSSKLAGDQQPATADVQQMAGDEAQTQPPEAQWLPQHIINPNPETLSAAPALQAAAHAYQGPLHPMPRLTLQKPAAPAASAISPASPEQAPIPTLPGQARLPEVSARGVEAASAAAPQHPVALHANTLPAEQPQGTPVESGSPQPPAWSAHATEPGPDPMPAWAQGAIKAESTPTSHRPAEASTHPNAAALAGLTTALNAPGRSQANPQSLTHLQEKLDALNGVLETPTPEASSEAIAPEATASAPKTSTGPVEFSMPGSDMPALETAPPISAPAATVSNNGSASGQPAIEFVSQAQHPTDQVVEGTAYSVKNGHKELIIRLNPDNLGEVRVNFTSHGNQELSARLIASTPESHELLQSQIQSLKTSLEAQGIHVERLTVVLAGSEARGDLGQNAQSGHQQQHAFHQEPTGQQRDFGQQSQDQSNQANAGFMTQTGQGSSQQKPGFAHPPGTAHLAADPHEAATDNHPPEPRPSTHADGRVSVLA